MKKLAVLMMSILMAVSIYGKQTVYIGTNAEFAPFEYLEKGEVVGFDMELIKEMAKIMDVDIKIEDMAFDGLLPALQMKKVDLVIAGMTATSEREKAVKFTKPYFKAKQVIIVKGKDSEIKSFDDLKGKKVGVILGFTGDLVVSDIEGANVERFNAAYAAIMALENDKLDAVVLDSEPAGKYIANYESLAISEAKAEEEEYAIALRKDDKELYEKLENALEEVKKSGKYDELIKKYF